MDWLAFLNTQIGPNTYREYLIAFGFFVTIVFLLQILKGIILVRLDELTKKTQNHWDDIFSKMLNSFGMLFYLVIAIYGSTRLLDLDQFIVEFITSVTLVVVTVYAVKALQIVLEHSLDTLLEKASGERLDKTILDFFHNALRVALWVGAAIIILQNLGYEIGALLGGLGIAGIAIAFALQNILGDIFSFFSIYFDKPFKKGDFIIVGNDMGTVEHIGMKTTRIKTLQGQELIISNQELTTTRVNNYKRMEERRVVFQFGIVYETPHTLVKEIPSIVKTIVESDERMRFDRTHFLSFGDSSLNFEVVYFVTNQDYNLYCDLQQQINLSLMEQFQKKGIEFAYPTRLIYTKNAN